MTILKLDFILENIAYGYGGSSVPDELVSIARLIEYYNFKVD